MEPKHRAKVEKHAPLLNSQSFTNPSIQLPTAAQPKGRRKYASKAKKPFKPVVPKSSAPQNPSDVVHGNIVKDADTDTTFQDKLNAATSLYAQWEYKDELAIVKGQNLIFQQRQRCKATALIIFGYTPYDAQIDAICTLAYEQRDFLLLARTGFGKSLIFQLLPFMTASPSVVLILMSLKLLQAEQSQMINKLLKDKAIVQNGKNNLAHVQRDIACNGYTHIFTSPEIALSKNFKKNVLDEPLFSDRLCLLAIDEIHLVEQWGNKF